MANCKLVFFGSIKSKTESTELEVFNNRSNEIYISICDEYDNHICLDISTAIKFSKALRSSINEAKKSNIR